MTIDIKKFFDHDLPAEMERNKEEIRSIEATFQLNIEGAGQWFIDASSTGPSVVRENRQEADSTITVSAENFQVLCEDPDANASRLWLAEKLLVEGNQGLAMKALHLLAFRQ